MHLLPLLLLARLAADLAHQGFLVSRWEVVAFLGLLAAFLSGFLDSAHESQPGWSWSFPFSLRISLFLAIICGLGFALPRWMLVLLSLGGPILFGFWVAPDRDAEFTYSLRTCVLMFIACGLVACFTAALALGAHWPVWLAAPVALVLSYISTVLLAIGVGGVLLYELVEPFCIIVILAHVLWPVFEEAKHKAELERKHRQSPGSASPARPQPQGGNPAFRVLIARSDTASGFGGFELPRG